MSTPFFPLWVADFSSACRRFRTPAQGSVHQLERFCSPWIPSWRLAQQDEEAFSRDRHWSLRLTFWCFLWQVARAGSSCRDAVRQAVALRSSLGLRAPSNGSAAYCLARAKLPVERLDEIHRHVVREAQSRVTQGDLWCGRRVRVVDATCLTMADTPENQAVYPQISGQKPGCGFPAARILASFCLATGMLMHWVTGHYYQNELSLLATLLEDFGRGEVLLGDRGFGNYPVLAQCLVRSLDGVFRANTAKRRVDLRHGKRLGKQDRLVEWHRGQRPRYMKDEHWAQMPEAITVRLVKVQARLPGFRTRSVLLVTTLLDPLKYPPEALAKLYRRRWEMELCFRHLKTTLQMDHLSCKTPPMIERELRLHILSHNLIRRVALEAARQHCVPLQRISFAGTLGGLHTFAEACLRATSPKAQQRLRHKLYQLLAKDLLPERPGRREPRAVKRRPKTHPYLTTHRKHYLEIPHRNRHWRIQKN
jgi:hypothetical protein